MNEQTPPPANIATILRLLANAKVTAFAQDADLRYRWIENPPDGWIATDVDGRSEADFLPAKPAALATAVKREVLETGRARWTPLTVDKGERTQHFDLYVEPDHDGRGAVVGVAGLAVDITARHKQAATIDAVSREQAHRTKNLLAVIQSLGTQTARSAASTEDFIETFRGRIQSISRSQDLSIGPTRHGARLSDLIETQLHPYLIDIERQVAFSGEDRYLTAAGALHVGLALYELCITAIECGALSVPVGKVSIAAAIVDEATAGRPRRLDLTWRESGGPLARPVDGFSKILLERIVPAAVGGRATMSETDSGRSYELTIADSEFE
jgi:two-component sensor histidine kinase